MPTTPLTLPTPDGTPLAAELVAPDGPAVATVVLTPATAVRRGYYLPFARHLAGAGLRLLLYDYRGIGGSRPARLRGYRATMRDWAEQDTEGALRWALEHHPEQPLLLVAHSFGGQALAMVPSAARLDGAVFVGAQDGWIGHWTGLRWLGIAALWWVGVPVVTRLLGRFPGGVGLGEALPAGVAREWARWGRQRDYLFAELRPEERRRLAEELAFPLLALGIADDAYAPRPAVEALLARYAAAAVEHRQLEPRELGRERIGHFGFFRSRVGGAAWPEIADWLLARVSEASVTPGRSSRPREPAGPAGPPPPAAPRSAGRG